MGKIPIQNIYYLLCYAWDRLEESSIVRVAAEDASGVVDLLARVLCNGTAYVLRKGLDRGHVEREDEIRGVRGKLLMGPSLRRRLLPNAMARCVFDELSHDVLHNRILKTTVRRLITTRGLDRDIESDLVRVYRRLPADVNEIDIAPRDFDRVRLSRNTLFYGFLMQVCRLIHENLLPDEGTGAYLFRDFVRDEVKMRLLFEAFVRNFYKHEAEGFKVYRQGIRWHTSEPGEDDAFLPVMETDTCLEEKLGTRKIVVETKFKGQVLSEHYGARKVNTQNLYQLFAYLKNLEAEGGPDAYCEGVLLYASPGEQVDLSFALPRHRVRVKTVDLSRHWTSVREQLLSVLN